jgi:hypothetical protein
MTPKNILAKVVYIIAGCVAIPGLIFFVPGGLLILAAFLLGCGADKMERVPFDPEGTTTIEEYEDVIAGSPLLDLEEDDFDAKD